jgi:D-lactate dehydrogenase (cytochrome)
MIIKTSQDEIQSYLTDASNYSGFCDAVYIPENAGEIAEFLKEQRGRKIPVTISGNGTGLTGARVPEGGVVLSTEKLNKILEISITGKYGVVEPGVLLSDFQNMVNSKRLLYPPDPTERNCFIGGTVATNASGEKTFKYGPTRDYIVELELLTADGHMLKLQRGKEKADGYKLKLKTEEGKEYDLIIPDYSMPQVKNASGYYCKKNMDAIDLFIGSEGTLGITTKIKLKLIELPERIISCVAFFHDERDALLFIREARDISENARLRSDSRCIDALALEFFDENSLRFLEADYPQIPENAKSAVWFEQEVKKENEDFFLESWLDLINEFRGEQDFTWLAVSDNDKKSIEKFRHSISEKVNEYISKKNLRKLGTDVAVPHEHFEELYFYSKGEAENENLKYVNYGHFGNSHMHMNILPRDDNEFLKGKMVYSNICKKTIALRGTISAEHGIGKMKKDYFREMYGEENISKMHQIKKILDPDLILSRGNLF